MVLFEEFWTESFIGFLAIVFTILILNAALLLGDSFTVFRYDSTDYFALFKYAIYFPEIPDKVALLLIAIAPPLGILLWWAISRDDLKDWYGLGMFALIVFSETILFTATKGMNIFIV